MWQFINVHILLDGTNKWFNITYVTSVDKKNSLIVTDLRKDVLQFKT